MSMRILDMYAHKATFMSQGSTIHHLVSQSLQVCALLPAEARPLLVVVGSTNPVKVEAVRQVRGAQDRATPLKQGARPRGSKRYLVLI